MTEKKAEVVLSKEKRQLRYDFSAIEVHELSLQMANKTKEQQSVTEEKKTITSQYGAKLNELKATLNKLSNQIADGYELREVEGTIEFHKPEKGMKTFTRSDNGEKISEKMLPYDYNLFNQESDVNDEENTDGITNGVAAEKGITEGIKSERKKLQGKGGKKK